MNKKLELLFLYSEISLPVNKRAWWHPLIALIREFTLLREVTVFCKAAFLPIFLGITRVLTKDVTPTPSFPLKSSGSLFDKCQKFHSGYVITIVST